MSDRRDTTDSGFEPTIVPVRRAVADDRGAAGPRALSAVSRVLLVGSAVVLAAAGLAAVFVYLPERVERSGPEPEPAAEVPAAPAAEVPVLSADEIAMHRERAESLLAELLEQQQDLEARSVASWGDTTWSSYEDAARVADEALVASRETDDEIVLTETLVEAVNQYESALEIGAELMARSERIVDEALAAGEEALAGGNAGLAASQFALVLELEPDNARALRGQARAAVLPDLLDALARAEAHAEAGQLAQAADAYREALAIRPDHAGAGAALAAINGRIAAARFDAELAAGYAALEARQFASAIESFDAALAMRPGSAAARDALAQAERQRLEDDLTLAQVRARAFETRELWDEAVARYGEALERDATLTFAREGLERAQRRADLDVKLQTLIEAPALLLTEAVLDDARGLLEEAGAIEEPGPRLESQQAELGRLIELASTPISVTLVSDNATEVTVYRVGELGAFQSREIALRPGRYTAVGQRRGFRDVREQFVVLPGASNDPVRIVCVEPI